MLMSKQFCQTCWKDTECTYKEGMRKETIDNLEIEFLEKYYICNECGEKTEGDMFDYNVIEAHSKLVEKAKEKKLQEESESNGQGRNA